VDNINKKLAAVIDIRCKNKLFLEEENIKINIVVIIKIKFAKIKKDIKII
jgi:hypothetical protein